MCFRSLFRLGVAAAIGIGLASTPAPARAYDVPWSSFDFLTDQRWSQINNRLADQNLETMRNSIRGGKAGSRRPAAAASAVADRSLLALGDRASTNLAPLRPWLANTRLSEEQAAKVLAMYNQVASGLEVPFNDSASGMAAFLAGTYAAYTNAPFPDEMFKPLYEQFADSMSSDGSLKETALNDRIEYYQRMVLVGMVFQLLQLELQNNPDRAQVAAMREAARNAFTGLAGISPDRIRFTRAGLTPC